MIQETSKARSDIMRAVRGKDTAPEMMVRRLVHGMGYRYALHRADLQGKPDLVFPSRRKVLFVHGCFWHGHKCKRGERLPKSNADYWLRKIDNNKARDARNVEALEGEGWRVLVLWECELKPASDLSKRIREFLDT